MNKRAIEIAKDVIKQVKLNKFYLSAGGYLQITSTNGFTSKEWDLDFKESFKNGKVSQCNVCALGALLIGYVDIHNGLSIREVQHSSSSYKIISILDDIFSVEDLFLFERLYEGWAVFEQDDYIDHFDLDSDYLEDEITVDDDNVMEFYGNYPESSERLVAIMQNIIDNEGTFVFPKTYEMS